MIRRIRHPLVAGLWSVMAATAAAPALAITTYDSPHHYETAAVGGTGWSFFDGMASLVLTDAFGGTRSCSGALLWTGSHVLTAAHCLYDSYDGLYEAVSAEISLTGGFETTRAVGRSMTHGSWTGNVSGGHDLAVIPLGTRLAGGYMIDRTGAGMYGLGTDDAPFQLVAGFGHSGNGLADPTIYPAGTLRAGFNQYDALWGTVPGEPYMFDFDDYTGAHNAVGLHGVGYIPGYGEHWPEVDWDFSGDPVRGEVMIAHGDSGGPSFLDVTLVGVHSFINTSPQDSDSAVNASFGELGADTRVYLYADWIDQQVSAVPEPSPWMLLLAGGAGLWQRRHRNIPSWV